MNFFIQKYMQSSEQHHLRKVDKNRCTPLGYSNRCWSSSPTTTTGDQQPTEIYSSRPALRAGALCAMPNRLLLLYSRRDLRVSPSLPCTPTTRQQCLKLADDTAPEIPLSLESRCRRQRTDKIRTKIEHENQNRSCGYIGNFPRAPTVHAGTEPRVGTRSQKGDQNRFLWERAQLPMTKYFETIFRLEFCV